MQRPNYGLLSCVILLAVLVGVVGGGVAGGLTGYYTALNSVPTAVAVQPMPVVSASTSASSSTASVPPIITNMTLKEESAVIDSVRKVKPAVVTVVSTLQTRSRFSTVAPTASGSGVIIDAKGYIITNNHVIEGGKSTQVIFSDGTKAEVTVVGTDAVADIAVLKVEGKVPAVAAIGDSNAL